MKLNKYVLAMAMVFGASAMANAATTPDLGHGKVAFSGTIVDAPCSISPEAIDQTVDLGQVSSVALADGGKSKPKFFDIKLESCTLATAKNVTTTFTGSADPKGMLTITGGATGASVAITEKGGEVIKLGTASKGQTLQDGNNTLQFAAYLQGNDEKLSPGDFTAVADFTLAYQ